MANKTGNRGKGPGPGRDVNEFAFSIVQQVTGEKPMEDKPELPKKNPAAVLAKHNSNLTHYL